MKTKLKQIAIFAAIAAMCSYPLAINVANATPETLLSPETAGAPVSGRVAFTTTSWITAYASVPDETDDTPFITASGEHVRDGIIASNIYPFGTKVQLPELFGDKIFVVEDRMNVKKKNVMDIWMPSVPDAVRFGAHKTEVAVLD